MIRGFFYGIDFQNNIFIYLLSNKTKHDEAVSSNNAPAATLGDNNDILAGLKAKMEKNEKKK